MQQALDIGGPSAEVYADVALQSVQRMGMWAQEPDWSLVEQWARQALELAEEGSLIQGKALLALSMETDDLALTRSALAIAERLGDLELRCQSLTTLSHFAWAARDYGPACAVMDELLAVLPELPNPDVRATAFLLAVFCYLRAGKLGQAAHAMRESSSRPGRPDPHHRLHAASTHILLPTLAAGCGTRCRPGRPRPSGRWTPTWPPPPCALNARLLNCAVAAALTGDEDEARRLQAKADEIGEEKLPLLVDPPRIRLALARQELGDLAQLASSEPEWWEPPSAFLDALAALGDRERIEAEAPKWLQEGTFGEPFALRALGIARGDRTLLRQALERFEAMELSWHAEQTRRLL